MGSFFGIIDKLEFFLRSSSQSASRCSNNLPVSGDARWHSRDTSIVAIDSFQQTINTVLYNLSIDTIAWNDAQDTVRQLFISIQNADFLYLLKLYRKIYSKRMKTPMRGCKEFKFS